MQPFAGPRDEAKANEYRDLTSTVFGVFDVRGASSNYYFYGFGENFGRDDQFIDLRGGAWGVWRAQFYHDKIPHNLSWNALSPLIDPTGTVQSAPAGAYPPARDPALWTSFDYGIQRNTTGGAIELSAKSPWFVRADYNEVTVTGNRPSSGQLGTGSGNGLIEIAFPTDFKTKNALFEAGYASKTWNVKLAFLDSKFSSAIDTVQWANFYMRNAFDEVYGPPDSELKKWSLTGNVRQLPLDTTIAARVTYSELTNGFDVIATGLKPTGNQAGAGGFLGGPLVNYITDNTETQRFQIKGDYLINRNWSATLGYAYEKYEYEDDEMRGYQGFYPYYQNLGGTNNSWFSGAFANPSYKTNIVYVYGTYRFE